MIKLATQIMYSCRMVLSFPWKPLWKLKVPTKVSFFIWTTAFGKILTVDNLRRRQVVLVDWCCMRKQNEMTIDHQLLHWLVAWELWNMVCSLFGVHWVMPRGVVEHLASWSGKFNRHRTTVIWSMIPHCLMWGIWREMNERTFEGNERSIHD